MIINKIETIYKIRIIYKHKICLYNMKIHILHILINFVMIYKDVEKQWNHILCLNDMCPKNIFFGNCLKLCHVKSTFLRNVKL